MGAIVRTAGVGRSVEELQWDLDNLKTQWDQIDAASKDRSAPFLVFRESDAVTRSMRDYLSDDIGEVLVDSAAAFQKAQEYMVCVGIFIETLQELNKLLFKKRGLQPRR